jgi:hypothetical protein
MILICVEWTIAVARGLVKKEDFLKWFNLNGHHAKSIKDESEVSHEPKTNQTKLHQRIQE